MTAISDPRSGGLAHQIPHLVNDVEPPVKPPPALAIGPAAWIRNNLFSSWLNTLLTIGAGVLGASIIVGVFNWAIYQANWFIINYNLRLFMLGRYEPGAEWRVQLAVVLGAAVAGFCMAVWMRVSRRLVPLVLVLLALSFIVPPVVEQTIALPPTYLTAGHVDVTSGTSTATPVTFYGFIARAGENVTVQLANTFAASDEALGTLTSFSDSAANLLRGEANNRQTTARRIAEIEALLAEHRTNGPVLTSAQLATLTAELERLSVPPPVIETYALNQAPVHVRLLRGTTMEPLVEADLTPDSAPIQVILPESGWYVLEKTLPEDSEGVALLRVENVFPIVQRESSRSEQLNEAGEVISASGRRTEFIRLTDGFTTEEPRPKIEGRDVPMAVVFDMEYRGQHTLGDFLRLYLAPFLRQINVAFLFIVAAVALGYAAVQAIRWRYGPVRCEDILPRIAGWLLAALPLVIFALVYGVGGPLPLTDTRRWGGLMLTILLTLVGIIAAFPIGILLALGRRSSLPVVSAVCTLYIEFVRGVPLLTVLFMAQLLVPLVSPVLAEFPNVFRAMIGITLFSAAYLAENVRGGLQSVPHGQEEAAKALGMSSWSIIAFITLPQALRAVIPALVGQCISLFKDTSLVAIVGLIDLTGISQVVVAQTEFLGLRREAFIFITLIYFVCSYFMGFVSRRIENSGAGVAKQI